jgi:hypothetical protein
VRAVNRVIVAILIASHTGCSVSSSNRGTATLGGTAMAVAGLFIARPKTVDSDLNGTNDNPFNDDYSGFLPGMLLFVGGIALLIAGLNARDPEPPIQQTPIQPSFAAPVAVESRILPPLPEIAVTFDVLQLAKQLRAAAARGHCDAALTTWARVAELDPSYAAALREGAVLGTCR